MDGCHQKRLVEEAEGGDQEVGAQKLHLEGAFQQKEVSAGEGAHAKENVEREILGKRKGEGKGKGESSRDYLHRILLFPCSFSLTL